MGITLPPDLGDEVNKTDYEGEFYSRYAEARKLLPETERVWMDKVREYTKGRTIGRALDVGSGTGRFSPLLADELGAEVVGVEPSDQMRAVAEAGNRHAQVTYLKGSAEALPVGDGEFDLAWMSMVIHHIADRDKCAGELARALAAKGRVLIRNAFRDRLTGGHGFPFYDFFPGALEVDRRRLPSVAEVTAAFEEAGFSTVATDAVRQTLVQSLKAYLPRLRQGGISTLEYLTEAQREEGFRRMEEAAAKETGDSPILETIDLLVFEKR